MDGVNEFELAEAGQGVTPNLDLDGFAGPLDFLLRLARAQTINLAALPLPDIIDQLAAAMMSTGFQIPVSQKADWVVMAAWIVLLRSNLLLPPDSTAQKEAETQAHQLRDRLMALQEAQELATWLDRRPMLGRDVFARGQPGWAGQLEVGYRQKVDIIAFLWAAMDLFDDPSEMVKLVAVYRPAGLAPYSVSKARDRILDRLAALEGPLPFERLLPDDIIGNAAKVSPPSQRRVRAGISTTFIAGLELAKQGELVLDQKAVLMPIHANLLSKLQ